MKDERSNRVRAAAVRLGYGYIDADHRGDTLFACNMVLEMRRETEAE